MKTPLTVIMAALLLFSAGCRTFYSGTVAMTRIADSALNELAILHAQGRIDAQTDAKIEAADLAYRQACRTAENALIAYKESGDDGDYVAALSAVRESISSLIDLIAPFIAQEKTATLNTQLRKANAL